MHAAQEALIARIAQAVASGTMLRIRGGGSKDFYGQTLQGELLETGGLSGILSYEPSELVVTALAGTPLAELEALLAQQGQHLPFEPPHFSGGAASTATVGGMVAAGLSGPARASVGSVRDHVMGVSLINGRAEHLTFGGQVMKNVAGYDVSRLMVGALGTLGVITQVSLKVLGRARAQATLRFAMSQQEAIAQINRWGGQPLPLNASCWVHDDDQPSLYLRLGGAVAAVQAACKALGGELVPEAQADADWALCRDQRLPWFTEQRGHDLWRLSVPQTAPVLDLPQAPLIEWHGAQRWVQALRADGARVRQAAVAVGGHATLFRAADAGAANAISRDTGTSDSAAADIPHFTPLAEPLARIHRELKQQFDPAGIFNRGRMFAQF